MFEATKTKNVFKSKWNALFWSLSVMLTAYCSIPDADDTTEPAIADANTEVKTAVLGESDADRWKNGPHYEVIPSQAPQTDSLQDLQLASDKVRATIEKAH